MRIYLPSEQTLVKEVNNFNWTILKIKLKFSDKLR